MGIRQFFEIKKLKNQVKRLIKILNNLETTRILSFSEFEKKVVIEKGESIDIYSFTGIAKKENELRKFKVVCEVSSIALFYARDKEDFINMAYKTLYRDYLNKVAFFS